jgi:hypothetical protein
VSITILKSSRTGLGRLSYNAAIGARNSPFSGEVYRSVLTRVGMSFFLMCAMRTAVSFYRSDESCLLVNCLVLMSIQSWKDKSVMRAAFSCVRVST